MKKAWEPFFLIIFSAFTSAQTVEFRVDMGVQAYKGLFNPSSDSVKIAGNFNGWNNGSDILTDLDGDTIYTITKTFTIGEELLFRFIQGSDGWEYDFNRQYKVIGSNSVYSAYFNNDSAYLKGPVTITFACNMEFEIVSGRFNSLTDTLSIRGSFNGWSDDWIMKPSIDTIIYEITKTIDTYAGEVLNYKFAYLTNSGTIWENDPYKTFTITSAHISSQSAYFEKGFNTEDLSPTFHPFYPFTIKFKVNMNGSVSAINQQPFTSISNVIICGVYNSYCGIYPYWCSPSTGWPDADSFKTIMLFDDGTNGDIIPGDNIWSKDISFPYWPYLIIRYKYGANWGLLSNNGGNDNEAIILDHLINISPNIIRATVENVFGVMGEHPFTDLVVVDVEAESPSLVKSYSLEQNYPNPFNPSTKIKYIIPAVGTQHAVSVQLKVYDVLGNEVAELVNEHKPAGSYEVEFNDASGKRNLASGIYFYQLKANDPSTTSGQSFIQTKKMIFLK